MPAPSRRDGIAHLRFLWRRVLSHRTAPGPHRGLGVRVVRRRRARAPCLARLPQRLLPPISGAGPRGLTRLGRRRGPLIPRRPTGPRLPRRRDTPRLPRARLAVTIHPRLMAAVGPGPRHRTRHRAPSAAVLVAAVTGAAPASTHSAAASAGGSHSGGFSGGGSHGGGFSGGGSHGGGFGGGGHGGGGFGGGVIAKRQRGCGFSDVCCLHVVAEVRSLAGFRANSRVAGAEVPLSCFLSVSATGQIGRVAS